MVQITDYHNPSLLQLLGEVLLNRRIEGERQPRIPYTNLRTCTVSKRNGLRYVQQTKETKIIGVRR